MFAWKINLLIAISGLALMYSGLYGIKKRKSRAKREAISDKIFSIVGPFDIGLGFIFLVFGLVSLFIQS